MKPMKSMKAMEHRRRRTATAIMPPLSNVPLLPGECEECGECEHARMSSSTVINDTQLHDASFRQSRARVTTSTLTATLSTSTSSRKRRLLPPSHGRGQDQGQDHDRHQHRSQSRRQHRHRHRHRHRHQKGGRGVGFHHTATVSFLATLLVAIGVVAVEAFVSREDSFPKSQSSPSLSSSSPPRDGTVAWLRDLQALSLASASSCTVRSLWLEHDFFVHQLPTRRGAAGAGAAGGGGRNRAVFRSPRLYATSLLSSQEEHFEQQSAGPSSDGSTTSSSRFESPLGVRRRVKAVLARAKNRTGIRNHSEDSLSLVVGTAHGSSSSSSSSLSSPVHASTTASAVAEAASIGGVGGTGDVIIISTERDGGRNGVASASSSGVEVALQQGQPLVNGASAAAAAAAAAKYKNGKTAPSSSRANAANAPSSPSSKPTRRSAVVEALRSDVPAALAAATPLPFSLPRLSLDQKRRLLSGERIQEQSDMGREGSGYVVLDVKAPPYVIWECLLDFESYPETIPTVRGVSVTKTETEGVPITNDATTATSDAGKMMQRPRCYGKPSKTRASFVLSKFRLNIAAIHKYQTHPQGDYMVFTLDPECTNVVLRSAKGIWHTVSNPDGRGEEWTRVWLLCELRVSSILPNFIVDYAAKRAMPRATTWLKPQVEAAAQLWLKQDEDVDVNQDSED